MKIIKHCMGLFPVVLLAACVTNGMQGASELPPLAGQMSEYGGECRLYHVDIVVPDAKGEPPVIRGRDVQGRVRGNVSADSDAARRGIRQGCAPLFTARAESGGLRGRVIIVYEDETPFEDMGGELVWAFHVSDSNKFKARKYEIDGVCTVGLGCKYSVIHITPPGEPLRRPLDPYTRIDP